MLLYLIIISLCNLNIKFNINIQYYIIIVNERIWPITLLDLRLLALKKISQRFSMRKIILRRIFMRKRFLTRRRPRYFANRKRPRGGGLMQPPLDFCLPVRIFQKYFSWVCFLGSRNPTVILKKFYLFCMTLKIKVKHLFAWPFLSPVVNMIRSWSWCRF